MVYKSMILKQYSDVLTTSRGGMVYKSMILKQYSDEITTVLTRNLGEGWFTKV